MLWILLLTTLSRVMRGHHEEPPTELPTELECAYLATLRCAQSARPGLANFSGLLHDGTFRTALFNTFYYTIIEVPLSTAAALGLGLGLALLLNMNVRGQAIYRTLFYIPSIVPVVASSLIFVWIFQPSFGIVNSLLSDVHVTGPAWFFSITWSKPTFIILGLWGLGQPMVIYLAALQGVPTQMYEVAALEGVGRFSGCAM
jgi:multiple sugar transport system permease protein